MTVKRFKWTAKKGELPASGNTSAISKAALFDFLTKCDFTDVKIK